jgi:AraC family transcriptional regulator, regulatory protein of adaptative response / methylated-DNA-[protein]-cysteine methyltransferase
MSNASTVSQERQLPPPEEMYDALVKRDESYEGVFFVGVKTTGIFCRPTCPARKPAMRNVEYFASTRSALASGYRACKRCRPMEQPGEAPSWLEPLLLAVERDPTHRWCDQDLRDRGLDPVRVRRWFKTHHRMTFHAYQRSRRLGGALGHLSLGADILEVAHATGFESLSGFSDAVRRLVGTSPGKSRATERVHLTRIATPLGAMLAGTTDRALCLLEFADRPMLPTQLERIQRYFNAVLVPGETRATSKLAAQLEAYFEGRLRAFDLPLDLRGTPFQVEAWRELLTIPYGTTRSYAQQAANIGKPDAVRAIGKANGDNRIAIVVPCHRVVGKNGQLTGYGGGLWRKKRLLEIESTNCDFALTS